jgi:hypothetical protein
MANIKREETRAKMCGMTHEEWKKARSRSNSEITRGRIKAKRPVSSLWDEVEGQGELFPTPAEDPTGGAK